jgi:hypothetical protein
VIASTNANNRRTVVIICLALNTKRVFTPLVHANHR